MARGGELGRGLPRRRRHPLDPGRGRGARRPGRAAPTASRRRSASPASACRAPNSAAIDVGNAGTLLRLLPGWLAGQPGGTWELDGDDSIRRRPVDRIVEPLRRDGRARSPAARTACRRSAIEGAPLTGISYELPVASAQVKSCLLFAGLLAEGETRVVEPLPSRDHTERMLSAAGADVRRQDGAVAIARPGAARGRPDRRSRPTSPPPPSSWSARCSCPAARSPSTGVGLNPTRTGLLGDARADGGGGRDRGRGRARRRAGRDHSRPRLATLRAHRGRRRRGAAGDRRAAAGRARRLLRRGDDDDRRRGRAAPQGVGPDRDRRRGADRARRPRSRRPRTGWRIEGTGGLRGGAVDSHGDHRIAMLGAVAGLASRDGVEVDGMEAAAVSYPGFEGDLASLLLDADRDRRGHADRLRPRQHRRRRADLAPPAPARRALDAGDRRTGPASAPARRCRATTSRSRRRSFAELLGDGAHLVGHSYGAVIALLRRRRAGPRRCSR